MAGKYDRIRTAEVMGVRRYIEEGDHILLIKRCQQATSTNTEKTKNNPNLEKVVIDFKVVATELLEGSTMIDPGDGKPAKKAQGRLAEFDPLRINESCSLVETSESQGYGGNVLSVTAGVLGMTTAAMSEDPNFDAIFESAFVSAEQIFAGMLVRCIAQQVKTTSPKAKSPVYTAKTWEAVPAADYAKYGFVAPAGAYDPSRDGEAGEGGEEVQAEAADYAKYASRDWEAGEGGEE